MTTIQARRGTAEQWTLVDPILGEGEFAVELHVDTGINKFKLGDGVHLWSELPYFVDDETVTAAISTAITSALDVDDSPTVLEVYEAGKE